MIYGTRNTIQARIDENYEVIKRLISTVPNWIQSSFAEADEQAREIALHNCDFDREVFSTIYNSIYGQVRPEDEEWMIREFYRSFVLLICSFAETTMKTMMKGPFGRREFQIRFIEDSYNKIVDKFGISGFPEIEVFWPGYGDFFDKRNDIAHGFKDEVDYEALKEVIVSKEELSSALEGAYKLLRSTADAIDIKIRGTVPREVSYLWIPKE